MTSEPLGPDSLTWQRFGDVRHALLTAWAGTLQAMHPDIDDALLEHSDVFDDTTDRLVRSAGPILAAVYGDTDAATAIRRAHHDVTGERSPANPASGRYHALDPDAFYWAHATFVAMQFAAAGRLTEPLDDAQRAQLFEESKRWYAGYGLSRRPVPEDWQQFTRYWDDTVAHTLRHSRSVERGPFGGEGRLAPPKGMRTFGLWPALGPLTAHGLTWVANGLMPPAAREHLGWRWTRRDELAFRAFCLGVRTSFRALPARLRYVPAARQALRETAPG